MSFRYLFVVALIPCGLYQAMAGDVAPKTVTARLPITEVTVAPGRAVVTRSGSVQVGKGSVVVQVRDLPPAMDRDSLQVDLTGLAGAQLVSVKPRLVATRELEPERIKALEKEEAELDRKLKTLEDRHQLLGSELLVIQKFSPDGNGKANGAKDGLAAAAQLAALDPRSWLQVIDFAGRLAEKKRQAVAEVVAGKKTIELRKKEVAGLLTELRRTSVPARIVADVTLRAPAAGNIGLTLRYMVEHVSWYPVYEIHADEEGRSLTIERHALVGQHTGEHWNGVRLNFVTLPPEKAVAVPEIMAWHIAYRDVHGAVESRDFGKQRPEAARIASLTKLPGPEALMALRAAARKSTWNAGQAFDYKDRVADESMAMGWVGLGGKGDAFGHRGAGGRFRRVIRGGGSRATESAVDVSASYLQRMQRSDGSWNDTTSEKNAVGITSLCLLSYLGAGHTTKVGRYKNNVRKGFDWLRRQVRRQGRIGHSLFDQANATMAFAEGYAMTRDPQLMEAALRTVRQLDRMLQNRVFPLIPGLVGSRFPNGMENLAFAAMAAKSCKVAGLPVSKSLFESLIILANQLERRRSGPRAAAVVACVHQFLGGQVRGEWLETITRSLPKWERGRFHVGYLLLGTLVCFQTGGDAWRSWNAELRSVLLKHQTKAGWPAEDTWIGPTRSRVAMSAICGSCLQVYYRYLPLHGGEGKLAELAEKAWEPVTPLVSADGRFYRFRADGLRTVVGDGRFQRIPIDRRTIKATPRHVSTPVVYTGVYLQSKATNPFDEPLLDGAARVFLGREFIGETPLRGVAPGKELLVPLGEDPYVNVTRDVTEETTRSEGLTKLYTVHATIKIGLKNTRKTPVSVRVFERLAVSADPRVRVRNGKREGGRASAQEKDGLFHWDIDLKASQAGTLRATYEVEYPEGVVPGPRVNGNGHSSGR